MTLREAIDNWDGFTTARKIEVFERLLKAIDKRGFDLESDVFYDFLEYYAELEDEDVFGTEGLSV